MVAAWLVAASALPQPVGRADPLDLGVSRGVQQAAEDGQTISAFQRMPRRKRSM